VSYRIVSYRLDEHVDFECIVSEFAKLKYRKSKLPIDTLCCDYCYMMSHTVFVLASMVHELSDLLFEIMRIVLIYM